MHLGALCKSLKKWVLTTDRAQRNRMAMTGISVLIALCCIVVINLAALAGTIRSRTQAVAIARRLGVLS